MKELLMIDLRDTKVVEICMGAEGQLWVNVDGICRLRIYNAGEIRIENNREKWETGGL